jgi:hypothetical protein
VRAHGARAVVSWGTAGALRAQAATGTLLLPVCVGTATERWPVDRVWHANAVRRLGADRCVYDQLLVHSDTVIADPAAKRALAGRTGGCAVDMESIAIMRAAAALDVPGLVLRAIVDDSETALSSLLTDSVDAYGRARLLPLLRDLSMRPAELRNLWRLRRAFGAALARLAEASLALGSDLGFGSAPP